MKFQITTLIVSLFITSVLSAQQIGDGYAPVIPDFTVPLKSGIYNAPNPIGTTPDNSNPWQHLFVMRHIEQNNNHQLQLASSITVNDRLFFRKIADYGLNPQNTSWQEIATRGTNNFTGDQSISGNLNVTSNDVAAFFKSAINSVPVSIINLGHPLSTIGFKGSTSLNEFNVRVGADGNDFISYTSNVERMRINSMGNVGIGVTNPSNKLDVNGTIHSKEVKVDMLGWSDFVFKKEYNLPTLEEVEKHINEKGHLENIPSEKEVLENGINLGEMNAKLLQKIEEMTLYIIEQEKRNNKQSIEIEESKKEIESLKKENETFKSILERLSKIEEKLK